MKTRIADWLLGIIIGVVFIFLILPKHVDYDDLLKKQDQKYAHKIDSLVKVIDILQFTDSIYTDQINKLRGEKSKAKQTSDYYRKKYENLKNIPVPAHLNQQQYDSLLSTIIR